MSELQHSKPVRLAAAALQAALADNWPAAGRYVKRIDDECRDGGIGVALMAWCDTLTDHATDGQIEDEGQRVNIAFGNSSTGELGKVGDVPTAIGWAGRLAQARTAMDEAAWVSLIGELPEDGFAVAEHVMAVLNIVATTVNGLPRGYALMGRGA